MKKTLIALAAVASTAAFAQSSVTIDGMVSLGVVKTNDKEAALDSLNGTNQIRFRGVEDLGGGLKANFVLAQRFSPESGGNDGTANGRPTFQGESTVGLSGGFGAVKVGRALHAYQLGIIERKRARGLTLDAILKVNAAPGFSEHHSGRALDIGTPGEPAAEESFEHTAAFAWLQQHAAAFGFRLSYPRDNPHGIVYEPWHWYFTG